MSSSRKTCPNCGKVTRNVDALYCATCATPFDNIEYAARETTVPTPAAQPVLKPAPAVNKTRCLKCNLLYDENFYSCARCGNPNPAKAAPVPTPVAPAATPVVVPVAIPVSTPVALVTCPHCGAATPTDNPFCIDCGERTSAPTNPFVAAAPVPTPAAPVATPVVPVVVPVSTPVAQPQAQQPAAPPPPPIYVNNTADPEDSRGSRFWEWLKKSFWKILALLLLLLLLFCLFRSCGRPLAAVLIPSASTSPSATASAEPTPSATPDVSPEATPAPTESTAPAVMIPETSGIYANVNGQQFVNSGENLDTNLGKRTTFTNRKVVVPAKAWNETLTKEELKLVETTWVDMKLDVSAGKTAVIFTGGLEQGTNLYETGALISVGPGHYEFRMRNGEVVIWNEDQETFKANDLQRIITQIKNGNFDIKSALSYFGCSADLLTQLPDDLVRKTNSQIIAPLTAN